MLGQIQYGDVLIINIANCISSFFSALIGRMCGFANSTRVYHCWLTSFIVFIITEQHF